MADAPLKQHHRSMEASTPNIELFFTELTYGDDSCIH
jgi:hypothetical protein